MYTKKRGSRSAFTRVKRQALGSYKGEVARAHRQGGFIQNFCVNKFSVLPLCYPYGFLWPIFLHEYTYTFCGLFSIVQKASVDVNISYY
jgi:hypothetical protein